MAWRGSVLEGSMANVAYAGTTEAPHGIAVLRPWANPQRILRPVATLALLLCVWEFFVRIEDVPPALLPPPSLIAFKLVHLFPLLIANVGQTSLEMLVAFGLSSVIGIVLGMALAYSKFLSDCFYPNLIFLQIVPKIAVAPLFVAWLGIHSQSRIGFAIFLSFFPVFIATYSGLRQVDQDAVRLCRSLRAPEWRVLLRLRLPYALPYLFGGMKITATLAVIGIVVGEFIASQGGLGYLILFASAQQQTDVSMAAIFCLGVVGLALYGAVATAEYLVNRRLGFLDA
jgi:NitT/TauT family transport system permease protein